MSRATLLLALGLAACGTGGTDARGVAVGRTFAFAPLTTDEAAGYLTLVATEHDTLLGLTTPDAAGVMLHRQVVEGATARMEHVPALTLAPGDTVALAPGGLHLMFTQLRTLPEPGDTLRVALRFARAGTVDATLVVRAYADGEPE